MTQFFSTTFWKALLTMTALYGLGAVGYYTGTSATLLALVAIMAALLAMKRLDVALYLAFIELFSNAHGALLLADVGGFAVSLRMALFVGIMAGWGMGWCARHYRPSLYDGRARIFALIALASALGLTLGALSGDPVAAFKDGNAYFYLFYLLPILSVDWNSAHRHDLLQILAAGAVWAAFVSFAILYIFTHFWVALLTPVYEFIRDLRIAEVTDVGGGVYRVFNQSQMFTAIFGFFVLAMSGSRERLGWRAAAGAVVVATVLLTFSRSFWIGLLPAIVWLGVALYLAHRPRLSQLARAGVWSVVSVLGGVALLFAVVLFPIPDPSLGGGSLADSLKDRTTQTQDAGISSRWKLLAPMMDKVMDSPLIGHGFGASVTFQTDDPRVRAFSPDGTWTTSSMEWGWLELWIKMGVLGPLAFLYAGYELIKRLWAYRWTQQAWLGFGLVTGLVFIFATHFFSPYLNHPIGLGYLLFLVPFLPIKKEAHATGTAFLKELVSVRQPAVGVAAGSSLSQTRE